MSMFYNKLVPCNMHLFMLKFETGTFNKKEAVRYIKYYP